MSGLLATSQLLPSGKSDAVNTPLSCTLIHAYAVAMFPVLHSESKLSHDNKWYGLTELRLPVAIAVLSPMTCAVVNAQHPEHIPWL